MEDRKLTLSQISDEFDLDIIYAFGSQAKEVVRWINGEAPALRISSLSDVDIGAKPIR